jgi:hypothetical protein
VILYRRPHNRAQNNRLTEWACRNFFDSEDHQQIQPVTRAFPVIRRI